MVDLLKIVVAFIEIILYIVLDFKVFYVILTVPLKKD